MSGVNVHATAVALDAAHGVLILGRSGAGKSELALRLMAFGVGLVADDRVDLTVEAGGVWARAPAVLSGLIETRGVGVLRADPIAAARIILVVDLDTEETERLPPFRHHELLGIRLPLVLRQRGGHLDVAVLQWLKGGRAA